MKSLISKQCEMDECPYPSRKHPAHFQMADKFGCSNIVFVTVCSKVRKKIFAFEDIHNLMVSSWGKAEKWKIGKYMIMPDHIHFFCACSSFENSSLKSWIKYWKSEVSLHWPQKEEQPIWQQDFWDTKLRSGEKYVIKWDYVKNNPVRQGLVKKSEEWPYQGELNILEWHGK